MDNIEKKPRRPRIGENRGMTSFEEQDNSARYEKVGYSSDFSSSNDSEYQGERQYSQQRPYNNRQGGYNNRYNNNRGGYNNNYNNNYRQGGYNNNRYNNYQQRPYNNQREGDMNDGYNQQGGYNNYRQGGYNNNNRQGGYRQNNYRQGGYNNNNNRQRFNKPIGSWVARFNFIRILNTLHRIHRI